MSSSISSYTTFNQKNINSLLLGTQWVLRKKIIKIYNELNKNGGDGARVTRAFLNKFPTSFYYSNICKILIEFKILSIGTYWYCLVLQNIAFYVSWVLSGYFLGTHWYSLVQKSSAQYGHFFGSRWSSIGLQFPWEVF